ncbi:E3 ubiquitin-protein ligase APD2 isoform X2 [Physcomitrium patens]|nr:uncharacterized protein LOC112275809 isoform X2 [Physcomitrium patens]XP_024362236.1 uncharacterized protein LOC112275809 isoform X2 [Physcomitrium patens]PNR29409.1 hypothetical protein PHYPA_028102 [Physcomitrium patens]|eukprot:XP_024362235.1 uncharacterized protein LOC112275809 isoform X2 [Physcomitrella patens]
MGRSIGGGYDPGAASACGPSSRSELFGADVNDLPRRRGSMDEAGRQSYYESYWDRSYASNQRSWSTEQDHRRREGLQAGYGFFAAFAFLSFFLSMWMLFGLYGNQHLEMGMFYARVVKANSIFVKEVKINFKEKGPVAYMFLNRPELGPSVSDKKIVEDIVVDPRWHKRFTYWLNSGSYLEVSCSLKASGTGTDSLIVAIVKGEDGFQDWKGDPSNPSLALRWKRVHEKGVLSLKVEEDDDYCIVFGNLNNRKITFSFMLDLRYVLYSKDNSDFVCSSQLTDVCEFPVALGQSTYVLLTSPVVDMQGVKIWYTKLSYIPRWITYIFFWGLVAVGLLFTRAFELRHVRSQVPLSQEHAPTVPEDASHYPAQASAYSLLQADETNSEKASVHENRHCTICLDAPKDSFFDPCGHRCTCYSCGMRIRGDSNRCPICRQTIRTVRRIYDA